MEKYQVVFKDDYLNPIIFNHIFNSEGEAEDWVNDQKSYSDDYDDISYFNPEDKQNYTGYTIEPVSQNLSEEFYRMQKLAGLITEEEYKARLWYKQYSENISKALDDLKQTLKDEGYDNK